MAQRQAQVDDVRWSRLQTELASSQNLAVMIFTIFTVIFLPLSFFTSLFGMNTLEWGGTGYPSLAFIGEVSLPASAFMILATLVAAFSSRVQVASQSLFRALLRVRDAGHRRLRGLQPESRRTAKEKRRADRERWKDKERDRRRQAKSYDFWASIRGQRHAIPYEIPDANRKVAKTGTGLQGGRNVEAMRRPRRGRTGVA